MNNITATTKYGGDAKKSRDGFKLSLTAELTPEQVLVAASIGLSSLAYRAGAQVINKALKVKSNSEATFTDESAATVKSALEAWAMLETEDAMPLGSPFILTVDVSRHIHGVTEDAKFTPQRERYVQVAKDGRLAEVAKKVGFKGDVGDGTSDNAPVEFLRAIKVWQMAQI